MALISHRGILRFLICRAGQYDSPGYLAEYPSPR